MSGQPFRLKLWKLLALSWQDSEAGFLDTLQTGVRLGVSHRLEPSPAWPVRQQTTTDDEPLVECSSAWKSALDHHTLVEELVEAEVAEGFIAHVPGGITALREPYDQVAVGIGCCDC